MPIYEFACPQCRVIFSFLSKRIQPEHAPACPRCGSQELTKQMSAFAMPRGGSESGEESGTPGTEAGMPDLDDPRVARAMNQMEKEMAHLDENNPRHMAHMMRKMQEALPPGMMPKEMDVAIRRLEAGEDPEKIEADMEELLGGLEQEPGSGGGGAGAGYSRDSGLYDY